MKITPYHTLYCFHKRPGLLDVTTLLGTTKALDTYVMLPLYHVLFTVHLDTSV
jgi:hypothetical protein